MPAQRQTVKVNKCRQWFDSNIWYPLCGLFLSKCLNRKATSKYMILVELSPEALDLLSRTSSSERPIQPKTNNFCHQFFERA